MLLKNESAKSSWSSSVRGEEDTRRILVGLQIAAVQEASISSVSFVMAQVEERLCVSLTKCQKNKSRGVEGEEGIIVMFIVVDTAGKEPLGFSFVDKKGTEQFAWKLDTVYWNWPTSFCGIQALVLAVVLSQYKDVPMEDMTG
jgi:hypothetical protein